MKKTNAVVKVKWKKPNLFAMICLLLPLVVMVEAVEMVLVPAGAFMMGHDNGDPDEVPAHEVYLDAYYISKTEITNQQYYTFWLADGGEQSQHTPLGFGLDRLDWPSCAIHYADYPAVGVSWEDASAYAKWTGCRLPTEAEWEKAARGDTGNLWPWGNQINLKKNSRLLMFGMVMDGYDNQLAPVGYFAGGSSVYGVLDMAGNVWEWVADWYDASYYHRSPKDDPQGAIAGCWKSLRGGSWIDNMQATISINRYYAYPTVATSFIGFRLAKDANPPSNQN